MSLDSGLLITFLSAFVRCSTMLLSSPLFGSTVPVKVRILFCLVLSMSLVPVLREYVGAVPQDMFSLVMLVGKDVVIGLIIGVMMQLFLAGIQMGGAVLDVQVGLGSAQIFNPQTGEQSSPISRFIFMLGLVLILLLNGHHYMFQAFVRSYEMAGPSLASLDDMRITLFAFMGQLSLMALQIAAPVAAVAIVVDAAAGLINKAVPQTQPFLLALPAKLMAGMLALAMGLPALVVAVQSGVDLTFENVYRLLGG